jgi:hypothetical protein
MWKMWITLGIKGNRRLSAIGAVDNLSTLEQTFSVDNVDNPGSEHIFCIIRQI